MSVQQKSRETCGGLVPEGDDVGGKLHGGRSHGGAPVGGGQKHHLIS